MVSGVSSPPRTGWSTVRLCVTGCVLAVTATETLLGRLSGYDTPIVLPLPCWLTSHSRWETAALTGKSPTVLQRSIAFRLAQLRRKAELTQTAAAERSGYSDKAISHLEKRQRMPNRRIVTSLLHVYDADEQMPWFDEQLKRLRRKDWWDSLAGAKQPSGFDIYLGLEDGAMGLDWWEPLVIPGLMQAPKYARYALSPDPYAIDTDDLESRLQLRIRRQEILTRSKDPTNLWAITTEFALTNIDGPDAVKQDQLDYLLELIKLPNVHLQVIPEGTTLRYGSRGPFTLMSFDQPDDPGVVYIEHEPRAVWYEDHTDIATYRQVLNHLQAGAASTKQSGVLIDKHRKEVTRQ